MKRVKSQENNQPSPAGEKATPGGRGSGKTPRKILSSELFAGDSELTIVHAEEHYRLRITRNDKLILTK